MKPNINIDKMFKKLVDDGRLSVTRQGVVKNLKTKRTLGSKATGYWKIAARDEKGNSKHIAAHRLVWLVYKGPIPRNILVNHKDGNKLNCNLGNLELTTYSGNGKHAYALGLAKVSDEQRLALSKRSRGGFNPKAKLTQAQADIIRTQAPLKSIKELAEEFAVRNKVIKDILVGRTYNPGNYLGEQSA